MKTEIVKLDYNYSNKEKFTRTSCNLCSENFFTTIAHHDRYGYQAKAASCNNCGLTFLNPVMSNKEYAIFYENIYRPLVSAFHGRLIDATSIQEEQRVYAKQKLDFIAPFLKEIDRINMLDIGGSTGVVANHFREKLECEATIIDPAPLEIEQAQKFGLKTITGFVEDFTNTSEQFSLITLFQTVDHLLDISSTLSKVKEILSPNGRFFVDIVDFRAAYLRNASIEKAIKIDHPYYLTQETMELYLKKHGFNILAKDYAEDHLHIGYICSHTEYNDNWKNEITGVAQLFEEIRFTQNSKRNN